MEALAQFGTTTERAAAEKLLSKYQDLVALVVLGPEGELVAARDMNKDFLDAFPDAAGDWAGSNVRMTQYFMSFLSDSAELALKQP